VTSALREIRAQLEGHAVHSTLQSEEWFRGAQARGDGRGAGGGGVGSCGGGSAPC
jgi:hypothetical protein